MKYNVTLFGNKTTTADLIRHLKSAGHGIDLIVTLSNEAEAYKGIAGADDIQKLAASLSIPVHVTTDYKLSSARDKEFFAGNSFGIGICTGWQRLLPRHVLSSYAQGIFGFHGSCWKLPHGRGRSPLNWSMRLGGTSVHHNCFRYVAEADAGEVFNTTEFAISPFDSISSIQFKALLDMKMVSARLLEQFAAGKIATSPQPGGASVHLPKLGPEDGRIAFSTMSTGEILNLVNATSRPFPGAFAVSSDGQCTLRIWRAIPFDFPFTPQTRETAPGTLLDASLGQLLIRCLDGFILVVDHELASGAGNETLSAGLKFL